MSWVAEEHRMWHTFNEVPMGPLGGTCPWDACGWLHAELDYEEEEMAADAAAEPATTLPTGTVRLDDIPF